MAPAPFVAQVLERRTEGGELAGVTQAHLEVLPAVTDPDR